MFVRKGIALIVSAVVIAALAVVVAAAPATADAQKLQTTQSVTTKMRCRASAPVVGTVDADQDVGLTMTYPKYVEQGGTFDIIADSGETDVPTEESGVTLISLRDIRVRTVLAGGFSIVSATTVPGTGSYQATPSDTPGPVAGGVNVIIDDATHVEMQLVGPFVGGSILIAPKLDITVKATGAPGSTITSEFAGTIPANLTPPFPDYGYSITPRVNAPIIGQSDAAASCAPNYGSLADGSGEPLGTEPTLSQTTITPNTNPLVTITTPADGAKYLPDANLTADFACTETVYALVSCNSTQAEGTPLDFSQFGQKTFTVTATDANGGVTTQTVTYDVGGNVPPTVNVGADQTVNSSANVTLHGSATDPDTGQILSYYWTQVSGPPVTFNPNDNINDPFDPDQSFVAPRGPVDLTFNLRVDDGYDYTDDTVVVHVNANNPPVITNGDNQTINNVKTGAPVTMSGAATDVEGDTPITYAWTQVDSGGNPITPTVSLSAPTAASTNFTAPKGPGTLYFQVVATDSFGASHTGNVTVNVLANNPPVITVGSTQTLNKKTNATVTLAGAATDADNAAPSAGQTITYLWTQTDSGGTPITPTVSLSSNTAANPTFTAPATPGDLYFSLAVSDGYDTTNGTVTVHVLGDSAPVANAGPDQTPGRGKLVTLDGSGSSDPENDPISYAWTQVDSSGNPLPNTDPLYVTLSSNTAQKPTFTAPVITGDPQAIYFQLVVTDSPYGLNSDPDTVTINLLANQAPTANAGAAQTNKAANAVVTLNGSGSSDPDAGDTLSYAWTQVDGSGNPILNGDPTKVNLSSSTAVSPTFTAPHFAASTTLNFQLVVTDSFNAASPVSTTTVQINANRAPTVGSPSVTPTTRTVGVTATLTIPASSADADGDPVAGFTYQWKQTDSSGNPCAPACANANVTLTPVSGTPRSATFTVPAFTVASESLFFRVTVNDGFGATAQSTNLTVTLTNSVPTVQFAIRPSNMAATNVTTNNTTVNLIYPGQAVTLDGTQNPAQSASTTDPDGTNTFTYAWRQVTTSGGNTNCSTSCIFSGGSATSSLAMPTFTMPNTAQLFLRLTVTDPFGGASATTNFTINKTTTANTAPTVTASGPPFANQGDTGVQLTGTATDPQTSATPAQTLTYQWTQVDSSGNPLPNTDPLFVTLNGATTLTPTFTAPSAAGNTFFKLTVSDGNTTSSQIATVAIKPGANDAPIANAGPDQSDIHAGQTVTLDGSGSSDPNGDPITYAWTQVDGAGNPITPTVTLSNSTAQKPTFTAPGDGPETLHFSLVVTDKFAAASIADLVDIGVDANGQPVANAGPDQSNINAGQTVTLDGSGSSDPEGGTITYAWTQVDGSGNPITPTVTLSNPSAQKPTFAAPATGPLTLHFSLVVKDPFNLASVADTVDIAVNANGVPVANAGTDQSGILAGHTVTLDGSGSSDPEGGTITYAWTQVDGSGNPITPTVTLSSNTAQKPTFVAPATGPVTLHFSLVVTDNFGAASPADTVDIAVNANAAPVASAGPNQTGVSPASLVTLDGSATTDPEGNTFTYAWTQVDGAGNPVTPTVTLSSNTVAKPTFTAPGTTTGVVLRFRLVATDQFGAASTPAYVQISVGFNMRPIANAGPDQTPGRGKVVTLDGSGSSDPEGDAITYQWIQMNGLQPDPARRPACGDAVGQHGAEADVHGTGRGR